MAIRNYVMFLSFIFTFLLPTQSTLAKDFSTTELNRMSVFLSNFTELDMYNFTANDIVDNAQSDDMIYFGIFHNFINNYKSRIQKCHSDNCSHGSLVIQGKYVKESLKKYFDYDLTAFSSTERFYYDGSYYYFNPYNSKTTLYARVSHARQMSDGLVEMHGFFYNAKDKNDTYGSFTALAKNHTHNNKKTWAIIQLSSQNKEI